MLAAGVNLWRWAFWPTQNALKFVLNSQGNSKAIMILFKEEWEENS